MKKKGKKISSFSYSNWTNPKYWTLKYIDWNINDLSEFPSSIFFNN